MNDRFKFLTSEPAVSAINRINTQFLQIARKNLFYDHLFTQLSAPEFNPNPKNVKSHVNHVRGLVVIGLDRSLIKLQKQIDADREFLFGDELPPGAKFEGWDRIERNREILSDKLIKMAAATRIFLNRAGDRLYNQLREIAGKFANSPADYKRLKIAARARAITKIDRCLTQSRN